MSKYSEYGTGDTRLNIDSDITPNNEVLFWVSDDQGDDVDGTGCWVSKDDAKAIIEQLSELFGLDSKSAE